MQTAITLERRALYDEVWKSPIYRIADRLGITSAEVRKICSALAIPMPARNHWPRIQAGHVIEPAPLPSRLGEQSYTTYANVDSEKNGTDASKAMPSAEISSEEADPAIPVTISSDGPFLNSHVIKIANRLKFIDRDIAESRLPPKRGEKYRMGSIFDGRPGGLIYPGEGYLQIIVTPSMRDRALRLADGLLTALSLRGFRIKFEGERSIVHLHDVAVVLRVTEITKKQNAEDDNSVATGQLRITFRSLIYRNPLRGDVKLLDDPKKPIELQMQAFISRLLRAVVGREQRALEASQEAEAREERHRIAVEDADRVRSERRRAELLSHEADQWVMVDQRKRYLDRIEETARSRGESVDGGSPVGDWLAWARQALAQQDPTDERIKSITAKPNR